MVAMSTFGFSVRELSVTFMRKVAWLGYAMKLLIVAAGRLATSVSVMVLKSKLKVWGDLGESAQDGITRALVQCCHRLSNEFGMRWLC